MARLITAKCAFPLIVDGRTFQLEAGDEFVIEDGAELGMPADRLANVATIEVLGDDDEDDDSPGERKE